MFMVEYFTVDNRNPDCHPDFFASKDAAETEGREFMKEIPWAIRMEVKKVADLFGDFDLA